ncbi:MAG: Beta-ketoacyl synthase [Betaproteobacteria bacterium]|nr:Beta-ketoacyl synthase [Betaproteobacteria bacterium]
MNRVAITGTGVISPLGVTLPEFQNALAAGRSGIRRLPPEIAGGSGVEVGASVDWDPLTVLKPMEASALDRVSQLALGAAIQAIEASGLDLEAGNRDRIGVYWGTGMGGAQTVDSNYQTLYSAGSWRVRPLTVVMAMSNAAGSNIAIRFGLRGVFANFSTACSSSAIAIGEAMRVIAAGRADAVIAGGSESLLTPGTLAAWQALRTLAPADPDNAAASCKPFDRRRAGLVLGEGAAAFVLESERHAKARGARIHGYLSGYGNTCDATHISHPDAGGQARAMKEALAESGLEPRDVAYINAHGTATAVGDTVESQAISAVFARHTADVYVSSTKSLHGHLLGGAGALELAVALYALQEGVIAPTGFLEEPDPECDLRHVAIHAAHIAPPAAVMSNSFAFGGSNAVLIATRA